MPQLSVVKTQDYLSVKSILSGREVKQDLDDIPVNVLLMFENEIRSSKLKKPICSSRKIDVSNDSKIWEWFVLQTTFMV